jgi:hypothetical protein
MEKWIFVYVLVIAFMAATSFRQSSAEPSKVTVRHDDAKPVEPTTKPAYDPSVAISKGGYLGENKSERTIRTLFGPSPSPSETVK